MQKGFTLIEVIIVVIVLGVLAAFAVPTYLASKERALDNEARGYLTMIQAAENLYMIENGSFYQSNVHADLNEDLNVSLPISANPTWQYQTTVTAAVAGVSPASVCAQATRNVAGGRSLHIGDTDNVATAGAC